MQSSAVGMLLLPIEFETYGLLYDYTV